MMSPVVAAALAEHAHRQDHRRPVDPGNPLAVVRIGGNDARHRGAMPGAVLGGAIVGRLRRENEVPRIRRVGVAPVAVIRHVGRRDHVVAGQQPPRQVRVRPDAGVEHRNDRRARSGRHVPGERCADAARRVVEVALGATELVVGDFRGASQAIGFHVLDRRVARKQRRERRGPRGRHRTIQHDDVGAVRHRAQMPEGDRAFAGEPLDAGRRRDGALRVAELDDEAGDVLCGAGAGERQGRQHGRPARDAHAGTTADTVMQRGHRSVREAAKAPAAKRGRV